MPTFQDSKQGLSIIVPFYNSSNTIGALLNSIQSQDNYSFPKETIVVDDGSNDFHRNAFLNLRCEGIRYIRLDKNSGPLAARLQGIKEASFSHIMLVDSDDFIAKGSFSLLEPYIFQDYDFIAYDMQVNGANRISPFDSPGIQKEEDVLSNLFINGKAGFTGCKVFKKRLLDLSSIKAIPRMQYLEDSLLNLFLYKDGHHKTYYIPKPLYVWNTNPDSLSRSYSPTFFENLSVLTEYKEKNISENKAFQKPIFSSEFAKWYVTSLREIFCGVSKTHSYKAAVSSLKQSVNKSVIKDASKKEVRAALTKKDKFFLFCVNRGFLPLFYYVWRISGQAKVLLANKR